MNLQENLAHFYSA